MTRSVLVPMVGVWVNRSLFFGAARPGHKVLVELLPDGSDVPLADATVSPRPWGSIFGDFLDDDGHPVRVRVGQTIRALDVASDASFAVPAVTGSATSSTDRVNGSCGGPYRDYFVEAYSPTFNRYGFVVGTSRADGTFSKDLTSRIDLRAGDTVNIQCRLSTGRSGRPDAHRPVGDALVARARLITGLLARVVLRPALMRSCLPGPAGSVRLRGGSRMSSGRSVADPGG